MNRVFLFCLTGFLTTVLSYSAFARDEITCPDGTTSGSTCWKCGDNCTATLTGSKMTFSGTGDMYNYSVVDKISVTGNTPSRWQTNSPWNDLRLSITSVEISDGLKSVGKEAIRGFENMTNLKIGKNVTVLGEGFCYYCHNLTSVTIPSSVTNIEYEAFSRNSSLQNITFESNENLKTIGNNAFQLTGFTSIDLPDSVQSIGERAFYGTTMTSVAIPESVTNIGWAAFENSSLQTLYCTAEQKKSGGVCSSSKLSNYSFWGNVVQYEKVDDHYEIYDAQGNVIAKYGSLADFGTTNYYVPKAPKEVKRIYTVEEATEALGTKNKNTFSIKYR